MPHHENQRQALRHQLTSLTTESIDVNRPDLDLLPTRDLVRLMNDADHLVAPAVATQLDEISQAVDVVADHLRRGGRLIYLGAGTAGRIGILDASECPPTFGTPPELIVGLIAGGVPAIQQSVESSEDNQHAAVSDLNGLGVDHRDVVFGITASGRTPYVVAGLRHARSIGAATISLAANAHAEVSALSDIAIETVVGPEFVSGSTRLKAGTAQKMVLNMVTTISMVKLGKTFRGIMVDLHATNEKLRARSENTVMRLTGVEPAVATRTLADAGGSVKVALLMLLADVGAEAAMGALAANDGLLRLALSDLQSS